LYLDHHDESQYQHEHLKWQTKVSDQCQLFEYLEISVVRLHFSEPEQLADLPQKEHLAPSIYVQ
jgi:hypothetical protein